MFLYIPFPIVSGITLAKCALALHVFEPRVYWWKLGSRWPVNFLCWVQLFLPLSVDSVTRDKSWPQNTTCSILRDSPHSYSCILQHVVVTVVLLFFLCLLKYHIGDVCACICARTRVCVCLGKSMIYRVSFSASMWGGMGKSWRIHPAD